jgi:hypothetical protein
VTEFPDPFFLALEGLGGLDRAARARASAAGRGAFFPPAAVAVGVKLALVPLVLATTLAAVLFALAVRPLGFRPCDAFGRPVWRRQ